MKFLIFSLCIAISGTVYSSQNQVDIKKFFGVFEGQTVDIKPGETRSRQVNVVIEAYGEDGFKVDWKIVMNKIDGRQKLRSSSIAFKPTIRPGIYTSAMQKDLFGNEVPLDPVAGDPFVWATLKKEVLRINRLIITDEGGFELQIFKRSLDKQGLTVQFSRYLEGERQTFLPAKIKRKNQ